MDDKQIRISFGARVRELRKARGMTQEQLAEKSDLHWTYISGIERGNRNPALVNINRLAAALNVTLGELFDRLPAATRHFDAGTPSKRRR